MQEYTAAMPPRPVYEEPSVIEKVRKVKQYIPGMLRTKNLFGWRYFVEDLKVDIECEIYKYEEKHLAGVPGYEKEQGVGAYCNMAIQGAINYAAACNAQKRRLNFEATSLDSLVETEKGSMSKQVPAAPDDEAAKVELLLSIELEFGDRIRELAQLVLNGEQLSSAELMELRKVRTGPKGDRMRSILTEV